MTDLSDKKTFPGSKTPAYSVACTRTYYDCHGDCKCEATIWSISLELSITLLEALFTPQEASFMMFIVQASQLSLKIIINNPKMFIVGTTEFASAMKNVLIRFLPGKLCSWPQGELQI